MAGVGKIMNRNDGDIVWSGDYTGLLDFHDKILGINPGTIVWSGSADDFFTTHFSAPDSEGENHSEQKIPTVKATRLYKKGVKSLKKNYELLDNLEEWIHKAINDPFGIDEGHSKIRPGAPIYDAIQSAEVEEDITIPHNIVFMRRLGGKGYMLYYTISPNSDSTENWHDSDNPIFILLGFGNHKLIYGAEEYSEVSN